MVGDVQANEMLKPCLDLWPPAGGRLGVSDFFFKLFIVFQWQKVKFVLSKTVNCSTGANGTKLMKIYSITDIMASCFFAGYSQASFPKTQKF